ncbi:MAG: DUF2889 domain-containing protein [Bacteroidetes bacterium]|nr:DUF2889 domain-containing protein [Bacteroidota bacterium]
MRVLDSKKKDKLHTRKINLSTYDADDNCIIIEGELIDNNLVEVMRMNGEEKKPGIIHHMRIRLLVGPPGLTIKDAEAEMPNCPHEECIETRKSLKKVIGISIESGFSENVIKTLGGSNGCSHLTSLLITMGAEAVQGYFCKMSRTPYQRMPDEYKKSAIKRMANTCYVYRDDGPSYTEMMKSVTSK